MDVPSDRPAAPPDPPLAAGRRARRRRPLRGDRADPDPHPRPRDGAALPRRRLLPPVARLGRRPRRDRGAPRTARRRERPRLGRGRRQPSSTSPSSHSATAGAPTARPGRSPSPATCACRPRPRSPPGTPPPPSPSRPASATCLPPAAIPLRALAALVAYSRVHTGVHYPGDVVAGALMGTTLAQITTHALERHAARRR